MCFSTEASFSAALILGGAGVMTLKNCTLRSQFFLASIPFLFALQQLSEGFLWLQLSQQHIESSLYFMNSQRVFLAFAFLIWPIWIPLSLAAVEKPGWRRLVIFIDLACGIALSILNLSYALDQNISVRIINHSLQYMGNIPDQALLYPAIVLIPCFISSMKNIWMFGILVGLGYLVAEYLYETTFVSVWCFFAAIVSLVIYKVLKDNQLEVKNTEYPTN